MPVLNFDVHSEHILNESARRIVMWALLDGYLREEEACTFLQFRSSSGREFRATFDLRDDVEILHIYEDSEISVARDVAEFIGWHARVVYPALQEFRGYDRVWFRRVS